MYYKKEMDTMLSKIEDKYVIGKERRLFNVNETAARVYELCNGKRTEEEIVSKIAGFYHVEEAEITDDIKECLEEFCKLELVKKK